MERIHAVVVTYNRKQLLKDCIDAILDQTFPVEKLILIDNCSTDGTEDFLREGGYFENERFKFIRLSENTGGAGGFHAGMKAAREDQPDGMWIMDDDVVPDKNCLEELVKAFDIVGGEASFMASSIRGMNGEAMNVPKLARNQFNKYIDWYQYLDQSLVKIVKATFVSLLFNIEAVNKCGLPWSEFFIWGDDSEYTQRVIRDYGPAYMSGKSHATHMRVGSDELSIVKETNKNRIRLYFYYYRNNLIGFWEYENALYRFLCLGKLGYDFFGVLFKGKYKLKKMGVILKAFFAFVFGTYNRKSFRDRAKL